MAFGVKTNERPGTRAQVKYTRVSAYKAREVLDLIRGEQVARALEILEFAERDVAQVILKCLESAIANAEHNDQVPADELFVSACYADEGPTLKRWRPRARGRATRIRKRTCHITVIVSRLAPEVLDLMRQREIASGGRGGGQAAAEARRQRVQRSREAKAEKKAAEIAAEEDHDHDHDHDHDDVVETDVVETDVVETDVVETD
ncbi:MAG: 50S ribosomal protein L22, partial [Actinomycetes bacterium]